MAAPAYRASSALSNVVGNASTTIVFTIPAAVQVDDLMLINVSTDAASGAITAPSGWSRAPRAGGLTTMTSANRVFYKFATAADTGGAATATVTFANTVNSTGSFIAISGANKATPFGSATRSGQTDDGPINSAYPPVNDCLLVWCAGGDSSQAETNTMTGGSAANWTSRCNSTNVNGLPWSTLWTNTTDGATASRAGVGSTTTLSLSANVTWSGVLYSIVPATQTAAFWAGSATGKTANGVPSTTYNISSGTGTGDLPNNAFMPGMVLVAQVNMNSETTTISSIVTSVNGFGLTAYEGSPADNSTAATHSTQVFYKMLTEAECWNATTSETLGVTASGSTNQSGIYWLLGCVDPTYPFYGASGVSESASGTTPNPASCAVDDYGVVVTTVACATGTAGTPTAPTGYTLGPTVVNTVDSVMRQSAAYKTLGDAPTTPEDPGTWTTNESAVHQMRTFSFFDYPWTTLAVTPNALPDATCTVAYAGDTMVATGGHENTSGGYAWDISAGAMPTGLSLNASTGVISGTPDTQTPGTYNFTVRATDISGATDTEACSIFLTALPSGGVAGWMSAVM